MIISKPIPYEKNAFVLNEIDFGPRCHPKCANVNKPCSYPIVINAISVIKSMLLVLRILVPIYTSPGNKTNI